VQQGSGAVNSMFQQMPGNKISILENDASSPLSNMSPTGIPTVVLPNRKTDNKAGGSGAGGQWSCQLHGPADAR
jgi:hypothetical protein